VEVFFDDFSVSHTGTDIVQKDDYYPFGGSFNAYTDLSTPQQDYLYNGVRLNKTTQLYETAFRTYDPYLGRFNHIDPLAAMVPGLSPYHFGFNNPVRYNDPLGLMGQDAGIWGTGDTYASNNSQNPFDFMPKFTRTNPGSGNHWSDGIGYSDWSMWGGSQMYKDGLASGGFEFGGKFFHLNGDGNRVQYEERNGKLGYWADSEMNVIDYVLMNNKLFKTTTTGVTSKFYSVGGASSQGLSNAMDWVQGGLDVFGLVPGFGEVADGINALIYTARGDYVNAVLSSAAMIPFAGWGATGAKWTNKAITYSKMADNIGTTRKIIEFQKTTPINTRILFNDVTQGGAKRIIQTPNGPIIHAIMPDGSAVQLRNFTTKSPAGNHTTIQFIGGQPSKWKFNY
jgi:RHS repeat-associated protein